MRRNAAVATLGVAHYRVEFADAVRTTLRRERPAALAVELPSTLAHAVERAVRRLPQLSVVLYTGAGGEMFYLPIEPSDPLVEAVRSSLELGIPLAFVDPDVDAYPDYRDLLPDPWVVTRIGAERYGALYAAHPRSLGPEDARRESGMAWSAQRLADRCGGPVRLVCGLAHVAGIEAALARGAGAQALARVRREGVSVWNLDPDCLAEVMGEMPFVAALYERRRGGAPPEPEKPSSRRVGPFRLLEGSGADEDERVARAIDRCARLVGAGERRCSGPLDRLRALAALFDEAARGYAAWGGEPVTPWQRRGFARFVRRLAAISGALVPDLHDLLVAARGCVDDPFAYEVWRLGSAYPWQRRVADLPTLRLSGDDLHLGTRRLRLRRRRPRPARHAAPFEIRRRRGQRRRGEWIEAFAGEGICSYPPEDAVVEAFGRLARRRVHERLHAESARSEPFRVSFEDGVDVRETLRRWHEAEIWVRRRARAPATVGNVVMIFDEDADDGHYPFRLTWLGEHDEESDMAFYATDPREGVVGPGICRAQYGGFLLSYPPRRLSDIWSDPRYAVARSKVERLVLAALNYSVDPLVVVVAPRPPSARWKSWATRLDRRLAYVPLGQLSPATRRRLRVLHLLDGRSRRQTAGDYIA